MVFSKAKLFWKNDNNHKSICAIKYDDNIEYYTYLRNAISDGYRQVIITSEIMLQIIRMSCMVKGYSIYRIEFAEEDAELNQEVSLLIQNAESNPVYLAELLYRLKFLMEQSSIDIRRLYIRGKYDGTVAPNFFIQSNGIIGINNEFYDELSNEISTEVERCLL